MTNTAETEHEELLEWLGKRSVAINELGTPAGSNIYGKSANAISTLLAENARLKEAIQPFAEAADYFDLDASDSLQADMDFEIGAFRRARAALHGDPQ